MPKLSEWSFRIILSKQFKNKKVIWNWFDLFEKLTRDKTHSFSGPAIWNKTAEILIKTNSIDTFKHNLKRNYLTQLNLAKIKLWYYYHNYYNYHFANNLLVIIVIIFIRLLFSLHYSCLQAALLSSKFFFLASKI